MTVKLIIIFLIALIIFFIYRQSRGYHTVSYRIMTGKDIAGPVKFVMLSDLHDTDVTHDGNEKLLAVIDSLSPDFVVLAGDMITSYLQPAYDPKVTYDFLRKLSKKHKVYFGLGNHEQRYMEEPGRFPGKYEELLRIIKECGIILLSDSYADSDFGGIRIYGFNVPIEYYKRVVTKEMPADLPEKTLGGLDKEKFNILIAHNPDYFDAYASYHPDLVLSGHLHGGIVGLPGIGGVISPQLKLFPKYYAGEYEKDGTKMIVSRGIGWHSIPIRIFNKAEVVLVMIDKGEYVNGDQC